MAIPTGLKRVYWLAAYFGLGSFVIGYYFSIQPSIISHPGWKSSIGHLTTTQHTALFTTFPLSLLLSSLLVCPSCLSIIGPRYTSLLGLLMLSFGTALQASAASPSAFPTTISAHITSAIGLSFLAPALTIYLCEISPAPHRGRILALAALIGALGGATALWVGYAVMFWRSPWGLYLGWRAAALAQIPPSFFFGVGLPFVPESPRHLMRRDHENLARASLLWFRAGIEDPEDSEMELGGILEEEVSGQEHGVGMVGMVREKELWGRLWRAAVLMAMGQLTGRDAVVWGLPVLGKTLGIEMERALAAGALEGTVRVVFVGLGMLMVDKYGRRFCLGAGMVLMALVLMYNTLLPTSRVPDAYRLLDSATIALTMVFSLGYSISITATSWTFVTEIFPGSFRVRGVTLATASGALAMLVSDQLWHGDVAPERPLYFCFFVTVAGMLGIVWGLPETKGRVLEERGCLFGGQVEFERVRTEEEDGEDIEMGDMSRMKGR